MRIQFNFSEAIKIDSATTPLAQLIVLFLVCLWCRIWLQINSFEQIRSSTMSFWFIYLFFANRTKYHNCTSRRRDATNTQHIFRFVVLNYIGACTHRLQCGWGDRTTTKKSNWNGDDHNDLLKNSTKTEIGCLWRMWQRMPSAIKSMRINIAWFDNILRFRMSLPHTRAHTKQNVNAK